MKTLKIKLLSVLFVVALICFGAMAFSFVPSESVSAEGLTATDFVTMDQASIRKKDDTGIRFRTYIGNDMLADITSDYEMGTLIIPASVLGEEKLTYNGKYGTENYEPVKAVWNYSDAKLTTDAAYENGKFFNAVLDLSDFLNTKEALNGKIVARSYIVEKADRTNVVYAGDAVAYAPAYVGYQAKVAEEADEFKYLDKYVKYLLGVDTLNVGSWETINKWGDYLALPTIDVEDIEIASFELKDGCITRAQAYQGQAILKPIAKLVDTNADSVMDSIIGLDEGYSIIEYTTTDGYTIELPLTVSLPQVAFVNGTFKPKADSVFTVRASDVAKVEFAKLGEKVGKSGTYTAVAEPVYTVVDSSKIAYADDVLTIKKNDLIDFASLSLTANGDCDSGGEEGNGSYYNYELRITTTGGAVSTVPVYVRQATRVGISTSSAGHIDELVFLDARLQMFYLGGLYEEGGFAYMPVMSSGGTDIYAYYNLNTEWLQAHIEMYPSGSPNIRLQWTFKRADGGNTATLSFTETANVTAGSTDWLESTKRGSKLFDKTLTTGNNRTQYLFASSAIPNFINGNSAIAGDVNCNYCLTVSEYGGITDFGVKARTDFS